MVGPFGHDLVVAFNSGVSSIDLFQQVQAANDFIIQEALFIHQLKEIDLLRAAIGLVRQNIKAIGKKRERSLTDN